MTYSEMFKDVDWTDAQQRPVTRGFLIPGKRGNILATVYIPGGPGPHPTVLFCHGVPGIERLFEFGSALRQVGFCAVHFHYSGSWGSAGTFSLTHCMEDAARVLAWIESNDSGWFDTDRLFIVGHSLGGIVTADLLATSEKLKAGVFITPAQYTYKYEAALSSPEKEAAYRNIYDGYGEWVNGFCWDVLKAEIAHDPARFCFDSHAERLAAKPVLAIGASMDTDVLREDNLDQLTAAIRRISPDNLTCVTVPTDHALSDQRNRIKQLIADFLMAQL